MKPKKLAVVVALLSSPAALAVDHIDARSAGMAGTGIASGDFTRANLNPALLTRFDDNDDFYFKLAVGAYAKDHQDTLDQVDNIQDELDRFQTLTTDPISSPSQADADTLINSLKALGSSQITANAGLDLAFYTPSDTLAAGLSIGSQLFAKGDFAFDEDDETLVNNAVNSGQFDQNDIESAGLARAVAVTEIALSLATKFSVPALAGLAIGITPKVQRLDTYLYEANISNYDSDDYFEDRYLTDNTAFNLDVGLHAELGPVQFGLVGRNLIEHEIVNIEQEILTLKPTYTAAVSMQMAGMTLAADVDLIEDESFVLEGLQETFMLPRQWARVGAEIDMFEQVQLRAGYKTDLSDNHDDLYTLGLGLSPFDMLTVDIAGEYVDENEMGAALQVGFKF